MKSLALIIATKAIGNDATSRYAIMQVFGDTSVIHPPVILAIIEGLWYIILENHMPHAVGRKINSRESINRREDK